MNQTRDKDTRYFVEINLTTLQVVKVGFMQKQALKETQQTDVRLHKLFVTEGQYNKMVNRCGNELACVLLPNC